jgi:hypothetical protein
MNPRLITVASLYLGLTIVAGCVAAGGDPTVTGEVSYNGAPVESGVITFSPTGSGTSFGAKIASGKYQTEKAYTGEYRVMVVATQSGTAPRSREEAQQHQGGLSTQTGNYIPEEAEGNGKTVEIKGGDQTLDVVITGPPRK